MKSTIRVSLLIISLAMLLVSEAIPVGFVNAEEKREEDPKQTGSGVDEQSETTKTAMIELNQLCRTTPAAAALRKKAKAVLVFPNVVKGGVLVGGQYGKGVLFKGGKATGRYNLVTASYGFQAGAQTFSYAMFFMSDNAVAYLEKSAGWEIGTGPSVVIADEGIAKTLTTSTLQSDIYAFVFGQKGLMAGIALQGSKITKK